MGVSTAGIGYYLPKRVVTNDDLLKQIAEVNESGINVEGLKKKLDLNIAEKRHFISSDENGPQMAEVAMKRCLENSNINVSDIDLIIYCAMYRKYVELAMAIHLREAIGAKLSFK
jgi:3-oxoacyl-[acyl-carrier-protein] synthase III